MWSDTKGTENSEAENEARHWSLPACAKRRATEWNNSWWETGYGGIAGYVLCVCISVCLYMLSREFTNCAPHVVKIHSQRNLIEHKVLPKARNKLLIWTHTHTHLCSYTCKWRCKEYVWHNQFQTFIMVSRRNEKGSRTEVLLFYAKKNNESSGEGGNVSKWKIYKQAITFLFAVFCWKIGKIGHQHGSAAPNGHLEKSQTSMEL